MAGGGAFGGVYRNGRHAVLSSAGDDGIRALTAGGRPSRWPEACCSDAERVELRHLWDWLRCASCCGTERYRICPRGVTHALRYGRPTGGTGRGG
jgi:hypothetical protein